MVGVFWQFVNSGEVKVGVRNKMVLRLKVSVSAVLTRIAVKKNLYALVGEKRVEAEAIIKLSPTIFPTTVSSNLIVIFMLP